MLSRGMTRFFLTASPSQGALTATIRIRIPAAGNCRSIARAAAAAFAKSKFLTRRHVVAEIRPHVAHREEVIVVVQQEFDLVLAAKQAFDQPWRRDDLRREIVPPK